MSSMTMTGYYSPDDVAQYLGVSVKTVRRHYRSGLIAFQKIGRRILIRIEDVEAALRRTVRQLTPPARPCSSALDTSGRAIAYAPAEGHQRTRLALNALDALNGPEFAEPDQEDSLAALEASLIRNREGADLAATG